MGWCGVALSLEERRNLNWILALNLKMSFPFASGMLTGGGVSPNYRFYIFIFGESLVQLQGKRSDRVQEVTFRGDLLSSPSTTGQGFKL